jgi:hypothetical protein
VQKYKLDELGLLKKIKKIGDLQVRVVQNVIVDESSKTLENVMVY